MSFAQLAETFAYPQVSSKKDGRGIFPGHYTEPFRQIHYIDYHTLMTFDVDDHNECEKLIGEHANPDSYLNKFTHIIYSTHSSTNNSKRLRLIVELETFDDSAQPIKIDDYPDATRTFAHNLGVEVDVHSHKLNSFVYTPRIKNDRDYFFYTNTNSPHPGRAFTFSDIDHTIPENCSLSAQQDFDQFAPTHNARGIFDQDREEIPTEDLAAMLVVLDPDMEYPEWIRIMAAVHHYSHGADWGFDLINRWSAEGRKYPGRDDVYNKWQSIHDHCPNPVKIGTLIYLAEQKNWRDKRDIDLYDELKDEIDKTVETLRQVEALENFIERASQQRLSHTYAEMIAWHLKESLVKVDKLFKKKLNSDWIQTTTKRLSRGAKAIGELTEQERVELMPQWLSPIVMLTDHGARLTYINSHTGKTWRSDDAFNTCHVSEARPYRVPASVLAKQVFRIPNADTTTFDPNQDLLIHKEGKTYLNKFVRNENFQFRSKAHFNQWQYDVINALDTVLETNIPDPDERHIFKNFMAYNIFNIGKKLPWFPLLIGAQGLGKTILAHIIASALGKYARYTTILDATQMFDNKFSSIVQDNLLITIDEIISHPSHAKRERDFNKLKRLITEDETVIQEKFVNDRKSKLTANFLGFSNYHDALTLSRNERRVFVVEYPYWTPGEVDKARTKLIPHYTTLFHGINLAKKARYRPNAEATLFREALLSYANDWREENFHDGFRRIGHAYRTNAFHSMVDLTQSDYADYIQELIENPEIWYANNKFVAQQPVAHRVMHVDTASQNKLHNVHSIKAMSKWIGKGCQEIGYSKLRSTEHSTSGADIHPNEFPKELQYRLEKTVFWFSDLGRKDVLYRMSQGLSFRKAALRLIKEAKEHSAKQDFIVYDGGKSNEDGDDILK
jgi:hypothetical protein